MTAGFTFRRATPGDLPTCASIWRDAINDYTGRLGQPPVSDDLAHILRLYGHLHATDGDRFIVATRPDDAAAGERIVAFVVAVQRERVWFLSMLFVLPEEQGRGLGRALLDAVMPDRSSGLARGTGTDTAQPISNALYASVGIVPRVPLLNLVGLAERPDAFMPLPSGIRPVPFEDVVGNDADGHRRLAETVDGLEREVNGFAHSVDHRFLRLQERRGWLYHGPDGAAVGYGYSAESGRLGPVLVRDSALLDPVLGHLTTAVQPRGAFITWVPGSADGAVVALLRSGFRLEPFPVLLCWDQPLADLGRYLPISPGLL